jgi:predicted amidohydrolase YtcJ
MRRAAFVFALALLLASSAFAQAQTTTVFHNGKIVTVDDSFRVAQAIAIRGNKILAVGTNDEVLKQAGAGARKIDLKGRTVVPGLIDGHAHALWAGVSELREPMPKIHSIADMQVYLRQQAAKLGPGKWIFVPRTFPTRLDEHRMPTRADFDAATPNNPVVYDASYTVVVNSYALKELGITRTTVAPATAEIGKDANGEPNGILRGAAALMKQTDPNTYAAYSEQEKYEGLRTIFKHYNAVGITTTTERAATEADIRTLQAFRRLGDATARIHATIRFDTNRPLEEIERQIQAVPWKPHSGDDFLQIDTLKVTLDGGMTIGTAYQRVPYGPFARILYGHEKPDFRGLLNLPPDKLAAIVRLVHKLGWQFTAHTVGGAAMDALLDAYEKANADRPIQGSRMLITHGNFPDEQSIARIKRLGVVMDAQPVWLYKDAPMLDKVLPEAVMSMFLPLKAWRDAGIVVGGGSDHMIGYDSFAANNPFNPFQAMWIAVTRKTEAGGVFHPEQRISREDALRMFTRNSAYMLFAEKTLGSLEPGKLADLVVLSADILTCPEDAIRTLKPVLTMVGGRVVYQTGEIAR